MPSLLQRAVHELGIESPSTAQKSDEGVILLYLYGGRVVEWTPPTLPGMEDVEKVETTNPAGQGPVTIEDFTSFPGSATSPPRPYTCRLPHLRRPRLRTR